MSLNDNFADIDPRIRPVAPLALLDDEDPTLFRQTLHDFLDQFQPSTPVELALINQLVTAHWLLARASRVEQFVACRIAGQSPDEGCLRGQVDLFFRNRRANPLVAVQRYRAAMSLEFQRQLHAYQRLQRDSARTGQPAQPPAVHVAPVTRRGEPLVFAPARLLAHIRQAPAAGARASSPSASAAALQT